MAVTIVHECQNRAGVRPERARLTVSDCPMRDLAVVVADRELTVAGERDGSHRRVHRRGCHRVGAPIGESPDCGGAIGSPGSSPATGRTDGNDREVLRPAVQEPLHSARSDEKVKQCSTRFRTVVQPSRLHGEQEPEVDRTRRTCIGDQPLRGGDALSICELIGPNESDRGGTDSNDEHGHQRNRQDPQSSRTSSERVQLGTFRRRCSVKELAFGGDEVDITLQGDRLCETVSPIQVGGVATFGRPCRARVPQMRQRLPLAAGVLEPTSQAGPLPQQRFVSDVHPVGIHGEQPTGQEPIDDLGRSLAQFHRGDRGTDVVPSSARQSQQHRPSLTSTGLVQFLPGGLAQLSDRACDATG